jgi:hypothetical protein
VKPSNDKCALGWITFEVLDEVLIAAEGKDVTQDDLKVLLIMQRVERLAIFAVEVFHQILLLNGRHLPCVNMDTLAAGAINNLLDIKDQLRLPVVRIRRKFYREFDEVLYQLFD